MSYLDPKNQLHGHPALAVRDFLRSFPSGDVWRPACRTKALSQQQAEELALRLEEDGLLERCSSFPDRTPFFCLTDAGLRLAAASGRQFKRKSVEKELTKLLKRVKDIEAGPYTQRIAVLVVFGSYLSDKDKLSDLDVAFRMEDKDLPDEELTRRFKAAQKRAPGSSDYIRYMYWHTIEVERKLRGRSGIVSLVPFDGHREMIQRGPHKIFVPDAATLDEIPKPSDKPRTWRMK